MNDWMTNLGAGAKVMVLDSGVRSTPHLTLMETRNFTSQKMEFSAGHGTDMAETIGSRDPLCLGIAPYCDLYVAKVWNGSTTHWPAYEKALEWALEAKMDVINMSFGLSSLSEGFKGLLRALDERGTICLAAYSQFTAFEREPSVVTVGRFGPQSQATALVVGEMQRRGSNGRFRTIQGTSVSTAILSGIAACAKAADPRITRVGFLAGLANKGT